MKLTTPTVYLSLTNITESKPQMKVHKEIKYNNWNVTHTYPQIVPSCNNGRAYYSCIDIDYPLQFMLHMNQKE